MALPDDVTLRRARPDDAEAIQRVGRASWHAAYDDILGPETVDERIDEWWDRDGLRDSATDETVMLVADAGERLVGVVHLAPDEEATWVLARLYVRPERWGAGIGTALLDRGVERLPDDAERLRLVVLADNDVGVSFYESCGFEHVGERESTVDEGVAELEYALDLTD